MNANAIVAQLLSDAQTAADAAIADASARVAAMQAASDARIAAARKKTEERAEADAVSARARMARMAELDERKLLLADKRAVISRAFDQALAMMENMPAREARDFLLQVIPQVADGDETILPGERADAWLDGSFLQEANAAMASVGKPGRLTLSQEKRSGVSGLILVKGETEIHCTYAALLDSRRLALEAEVAAELFPEG